ncbi:MAG: radical SAM protein [Christensenellaceae bacterium]|nr:radical SAM protein [Christensenellaceae bacterium]
MTDSIRELTMDKVNRPITAKVCKLCPLECGADRTVEVGLCGVGGFGGIDGLGSVSGFDDANASRDAEPNEIALVARAARHYYEEPPISGTRGSGAIFFSGCNMACIFCQNMGISHAQSGVPVDALELCNIMLRLQELGSHNINLVTPSPHVRLLEKAIPLASSRGLTIPIVYNTNSYEKVDTLRRLDGLIDIYLPDLKYIHSAVSQMYSGRSNYFEVASLAVLEMQRQCGALVTDDEGIARNGLIIRHLVLPGSVDETRGVLDFIHDNFPIDTCVSLMSQYTPMFELKPPLNRRLLRREYMRAVDYALSLGFTNIYTQKLSSANEGYTPEFNNFFE